ncbi:MAG: glycosyltransferase family 4 protein [Planctomycetes bacterium]|nr:glycosyltransferase family 4 protein [Planctomycetota bacterium]
MHPPSAPGDGAGRLRVCLVAYHALPAVDPTEKGYFGGMETHAWQIAGLLAERREFDVRLVVRHHRRARVRQRRGVQIVTRVDRWFRLRRFVSDHAEVGASRPWLRIKRWRWSLLWAIPWLAVVRMGKPKLQEPTEADPFFAAQEADVYVGFGVNDVSASVISTAGRLNRSSILFLESDADLDERFFEGASYTNVYGQRGDVCVHALQAADCIVAQTPRQQQVLRDRFRRDAPVIGSPIDLHVWRPLPSTDARSSDRYALWIGRADAFHKRPLLLLDVAERLPETQFLMVMNPGDAEIASQVRSRRPPNVRIIEQVAFEQMPAMLQNAFVFVSTGSAEHEGFPNVMLQAAACGIPIASWEVDPGFIASSECGFVAGGDADALSRYIQSIQDHPDAGETAGQRGLEYVRNHHRSDAISDRIADLIRESCVRECP